MKKAINQNFKNSEKGSFKKERAELRKKIRVKI